MAADWRPFPAAYLLRRLALDRSDDDARVFNSRTARGGPQMIAGARSDPPPSVPRIPDAATSNPARNPVIVDPFLKPATNPPQRDAAPERRLVGGSITTGGS